MAVYLEQTAIIVLKEARYVTRRHMPVTLTGRAAESR
jgi:hypothetical protein